MRTGLKFTKQHGKVLPFIQDGEHFFKKGIKAYRQGDLKKSQYHLLRAVRMDEEEPTFLCQLAVVTAELGDYQEANEMLEKVLNELEPEMLDCYYFLANNYAYLGLFHEAKVNVEQYLAQAPDGEFIEDAYELMKLLQIEDTFDGESNESLQAEESLIIRHDQAKKLLGEGKLSEAEQVLKQLISDYPEFWSAYNNLSITYFQQGLVAEAVALTEDVLEKSAGNLHALCNLAVFCHYLDDKTKTRNLQAQLEVVYPIETECRCKLGTTLVLLGSYAQGYKWLRSLYKKGFKGEASFYYWLAVSAYQLGDEAFAEVAWEKFAKSHPEKADEKPWKHVKEDEMSTEQRVYDDFHKVLYEAESNAIKYFTLFALYQNSNKEAAILIKEFVEEEAEDDLLKSFACTLLKEKGMAKGLLIAHEKQMQIGVEVAQQLFELIEDQVHTVNIQGLYMIWFTVFTAMLEHNITLMSNVKAWSAAVEYVWGKNIGEPKTQKALASKYRISPSTIGKYVKVVKYWM